MHILIFEHVCGGGMVGEPLPTHLALQGGAMLAAAVAQFRAAGCAVSTLIDGRVELALGDADVTRIASGDDVVAHFDRALENADAALVIAPECDGVLERWTQRVESSGVRNLGSASGAVAICGDKLACAGQLERAGVPTPSTWRFDAQAPLPIDLPVLIKPRDGAGCERTFVCRDANDLDALPAMTGLIVQPYVSGRPASVSALVQGAQVRPLAAGEQRIVGTTSLAYEGGVMPLDAALGERAIALARRALGALPGLHGFVGVDLVLADRASADVVIEINPRLTVSFVALTGLGGMAVARAILDPSFPTAPQCRAFAYDAAGHALSETGAPQATLESMQ